jgi:SAM-dependent methyltransferase
MGGRQDKAEEVRFFGEYARDGEYDVFTPDTNEKIVARCVALSGLRPGARVADLGCGTGVFTRLLEQRGLLVWGLDISHALTVVGRRKRPELRLVVGDIERLPFPTGSFEGVMLSGVVHHLPDPAQCAHEVYRVLMPGGVFTAFDPNRINPFMWLYRDPSSPFHSRVGVTENERPVLAGRLSEVSRMPASRSRQLICPGRATGTSLPLDYGGRFRFATASTASCSRCLS